MKRAGQPLTADTITDEQILALNSDPRSTLTTKAWCIAAMRHSVTKKQLSERAKARARCAEILNARAEAEPVCRACEGDGFVAADGHTTSSERVTRDSKRCPYCNGVKS